MPACAAWVLRRQHEVAAQHTHSAAPRLKRTALRCAALSSLFWRSVHLLGCTAPAALRAVLSISPGVALRPLVVLCLPLHARCTQPATPLYRDTREQTEEPRFLCPTPHCLPLQRRHLHHQGAFKGPQGAALLALGIVCRAALERGRDGEVGTWRFDLLRS